MATPTRISCRKNKEMKDSSTKRYRVASLDRLHPTGETRPRAKTQLLVCIRVNWWFEVRFLGSGEIPILPQWIGLASGYTSCKSDWHPDTTIVGRVGTGCHSPSTLPISVPSPRLLHNPLTCLLSILQIYNVSIGPNPAICGLRTRGRYWTGLTRST